MVHENILLLCNISFDPLLTKLSSWSLKCSERNWLMYSLLKLTIVYQCTCIYEVLDNRAWIRIFPSSVYNILYTFREIIQFKQVYSHPKVDMYHHFYSKDIDKKFESNTIFQIRASNTDPLHLNSARRKPIQFRLRYCKTTTFHYKNYYTVREDTNTVELR